MIITITDDSSTSHGYHIQTARVRRTSTGCSICVYPCRNGRCSEIIENSKNRSVQIIGFVYHDTNGQKIWSSIEDPVISLERNLYGHPLAGLLWERQFEKILLKYGWEKRFPIGNACSYLCMWMTSNWLERKKH